MVSTVNCLEVDRGVARQPVASRYLKADLLLTHAYYLALTRNEKKKMQPYAPLGPLYVTSYLRQKGFRVRFYDTTFEKDVDAFARYLDRYCPPLVGISVLETTRGNACAMIRHCRQRGITVIAGGADPSIDPAYYLRQGAHLVVIGEGEETMAELLEAIRSGGSIDGIKGIMTAQGFTGPRPVIEDLDELPFPAYDCIDYHAYLDAWKSKHGTTSLSLSVARGCPYKCSWCARPVFGSTRRVRSAGNLAEEMLFIKAMYSPGRVHFADDLFTADRDWVHSFREEVRKRRARIPFECCTRVDLVDKDILSTLYEAGCVRIWYGVESGSQKILERMGKDFNVEDIRRNAALTRQAGMEVGYRVTIGHPSENVADLELTRQLLRDTRPDCCEVNVAYPHKGSRFYNEVERDLLPVRYGDRMENDNILTYKSRYSQNFYDMARNCIDRESSLYAHPAVPMAQRVACGMYQLGYRIMKSGVL